MGSHVLGGSSVGSRHSQTAGGHHGWGCAPTGRRRRISSIEVGKIEFRMTVHALLDFPELFETEVVIAESLPLAESRDIEDYAGALATSELHSVLLYSSRRLHRCREHSLLRWEQMRGQRGSPTCRGVASQPLGSWR